MSMRTDYQRPAGFGATRASIKAGVKYETKVYSALCSLLNKQVEANPDKFDRPQFRLLPQFPRNGGYVDFCLRRILPAIDRHCYLIEVKSQWSLDAYHQLLRYAGSELSAVSRVCICRTYHPHIPVPEAPQCLPLANLLEAPPGKLTIIPWGPRNS
jgi:hypothetical protein